MHDLERLVIQSPVLFAEGRVGFPADADYSADFGEQLGFLTQKGIAIAIDSAGGPQAPFVSP